jgi:L-ascorbate metabolism protein UlaG (beta-lactamase superfamily)
MKDTVKIRWFPPAWVQIVHDKSILYIDPAYLMSYYKKHPTKIEYSRWPDEIDGLPEELPAGNVILLTHEHKDHCKRVTIDRLCSKNTVIYGPKKCIKQAGNRLNIIKAGDIISAGSFKVKAVQAYNTPEGSASRKVHKKNSGIGYKVTVSHKTIYCTGDTSLIPEMKELGKIDLAFIPIDGTFTMNIEEAVKTALTISPKIVIPIHDMGKNDPRLFKKDLENKSKIKVKILEIGESIKI